MKRPALFRLFVVCGFPVHVWAIMGIFDQMPAWLLRNSLWEIAGMSSYVLVLAFIESLLVFVVAALAARLVHRWLGAHTLPAGLVVVWAFSLLSMGAHTYERLYISRWGLLIGAVFLLVVAAGIWGVHRSRRLERGIEGFVERLIVLSAVYWFFDAIGLVVIVIRNLG